MAITTDAQIITLAGGTMAAEDQAIVSFVRPLAERLVKKFVGFNIEQATYTDLYPLIGQDGMMDMLVDGYEDIGGRIVPYNSSMLGSGSYLSTRQKPVRSITSVYENVSAWDTAGGSWPASALLDPTEYQLDQEEYGGLSWSGFVYRRSGVWPTEPRTVKITYVAGLTAAELDPATGAYAEFAQACYLTAMNGFWLWKQFKTEAAGGSGGAGPVVSERLGDYAVSWSEQGAMDQFSMRFEMPRAAKVILEEYVPMRKYLG